jgi:hypothetical protein
MTWWTLYRRATPFFLVAVMPGCSRDIQRMTIMGGTGDKTGENGLDFDVTFVSDMQSLPPPKDFAGTVVVDDRTDATKPGAEMCRATFGPTALTWQKESSDRRSRVHVDIRCPPPNAKLSRYATIEIAIPRNQPPVLRGEHWMYSRKQQ